MKETKYLVICFYYKMCVRSDKLLVQIQLYLQLHEVKLSCARVHQSVKVVIICKLGLDQSTDVSLENRICSN